jgi:hypothetical protein
MVKKYEQLWGSTGMNPKIGMIEEILGKAVVANRISLDKYGEIVKIIPSELALYNLALRGVDVSSIGHERLTPRNFATIELLGNLGLPVDVADKVQDALNYVSVDRLMVG